MHVIHCTNVDEALRAGLHHLNHVGIREETRNGPAIVAPTPVTTVYHHPDRRVLFSRTRDANPFFHFFEALWMLQGRQDVAFVTRLVKTMARYSDDGKTFAGAYGHRWRVHFSIDQLQWAIDRLIKNPSDRRVVIGIWDPTLDTHLAIHDGRDIPCNVAIHFQSRADGLDMTVYNRSNDMIWGAHGANAVHFSMLHEFVARAAGLALGRYYQVSDNYHAYCALFDKISGPVLDERRYIYDGFEPFPMLQDGESWQHWLQDLSIFMDSGPIVGFQTAFFRRVVTPMWNAHLAYSKKQDPGRYETAQEILGQCAAADWRLACIEWLQRREFRSRQAADDGVQHEDN